jgi:hypothetical protein
VVVSAMWILLVVVAAAALIPLGVDKVGNHFDYNDSVPTMTTN